MERPKIINSLSSISKDDLSHLEDLAPLLNERYSALHTQTHVKKYLALFYIDGEFINEAESHYGSKLHLQLQKKTYQVLKEFQQEFLTPDEEIIQIHENSNSYLIVLNDKPWHIFPSHPNSLFLEELTQKLIRFLDKRFFEFYFPFMKSSPRFKVGSAIGLLKQKIYFQKFVEQVINEAKVNCEMSHTYHKQRNKEILLKLIIDKQVRTMFQPIFKVPVLTELLSSNTIDVKKVLEKKQVYSYEALSRGPMGSDLESAFMLFQIAEEADLHFDLDMMCWLLAMEKARGGKHKIFLNTYASTLQEPFFQTENLLKTLDSFEISPQQIVLELSEKQAIHHYPTYLETLKKIKSLGIELALDDVGCGYSGLENMIFLEPNYLKLDMSLIRSVHEIDAKSYVVKALCDVGKKMGSTVLAEGVETEEEFQHLYKMGCQLYQGFLLGRPAEINLGSSQGGSNPGSQNAQNRASSSKEKKPKAS